MSKNSVGKLKTIFFDLGGVLVDFSLEKMCQNIASFCQLDVALVKRELYEKGFGEQYEKGIIDSKALHKHFSSLSGRALNFSGLMEAAGQIFSLKEEMVPILEDLKREKIALFLLSNTCDAHFSYIQKHFEFLSLFDGFILSYQVGARKPEKKIYDAALKLSNTPKELCFYTDDVVEYVEAASQFGIESHLFQGADNLLQALEKRGYKSALRI